MPKFTDAPSPVRQPPPLPDARLGAPPGGRPPAASRPAPGRGGIKGVGVPPELRRRNGEVRSAPGAAAVADRIRLSLRKAQQKLLDSQRELESSANELRSVLSRRSR